MSEKKKTKRRVIGSVLASKDNPKETYIKIREDITLSKGVTLRLESKRSQLESVEAAMAAGKLSEEMGEKIKERISKIPDWVKFEIVQFLSE